MLNSFDLTLFNFLNSFAESSVLGSWTALFLAEYLPYLVGLSFIILLFTKSSEKWRNKILVEFFSSVVLGALVIPILRSLFHRLRPFLTLPSYQLVEKTSYSFPSVHATAFFALATIVFFSNRKWGIYFYVGAILISLGRVMVGVHYPSDILAEALLGVILALVSRRIALLLLLRNK